jgi:PAS domain S-box-containing protein
MKSGWMPAVVVGGLLALLTVLFIQGRDPDRETRQRTQEALRVLEIHDAELSRDVVMARAGQLPSYDPLMEDRQRLLEDMATLRSASARGSEAAKAIAQTHLGALDAAMSDKLALVEHFKSDNALARNSLMYLTGSVAILNAEGQAEKSGSVISAQLQHALLRFVETLDSEAGREIRGQLDRLSGTATRSSLPILIAHGRLIVDVLPRVDDLLHRIIGSPTAARALELEAALVAYAAGVERRAQVFRYALYFFSLVLIGYVIHQFTALRSTAQRLSTANQKLQLEMAERAQAEVALRMREVQYRAITQFASEAIISVDSAGLIVSWNAGAETIFGYTEVEAQKMPLARLMPEDAGRAGEPTLRHWLIFAGAKFGATSVESVARRKDGSAFPVEISRSTWSTWMGHFETGIIRDVTERKRLEETTRQQELQLIQASRMAAVGTLVECVRHEISNPLQVIMQNSEMLIPVLADAVQVLDGVADSRGAFELGGRPYEEMREELPTLIRDIGEGSRDINRMANDLREFAPPARPGRQTVFSLNDVLSRAVRLQRYLIDQRTRRFVLELADGVPVIQGDPGQMGQVFLNLLNNALDALPDPSHGVTVSTRFAADKRRVLLIVQDEGKGIAPEDLPLVCEPYFTTKQDTGGTGLGLAIVAALVRAHGGELSFVSEPWRGTCATVSLPVHEPALAA